jgi:hypothetical protein
VQYIAPSSSRLHVLGKYLVAMSRSIVLDPNVKVAKATRNRLDLLLVVNDVLHADRFHGRKSEEDAAHVRVAVELRPHIETLVELAAVAVGGNKSTHEIKLKAIINFWAASQCISADAFASICERFAIGLAVARGGTPIRKRTYALPEQFGDRNAPWHELPASYMVDHLVERPDQPINTNSIRASRLGQRQPSERVRGLLEEYFENIDLVYKPTGDNPTGGTKKYKLWLDSMGQLVKQNKVTGETKTVCNGYGWSVKFCQDMQDDGLPGRVAEKRENFRENIRLIEERRRQDALRKRSSPSFSPSPPRRRRYSSSVSSRESDDDRSRTGDSDRPRTRDSNGEKQYDRKDRPSQRHNRSNDAKHEYEHSSLHSQPPWNTNQANHPPNNSSRYSGLGNTGYVPSAHGYPEVSQPFRYPPGFADQFPIENQMPYVPVQYPINFSHQFQPPPFHNIVGGPPSTAYRPSHDLVGQPGQPYVPGGNNASYGSQGNTNAIHGSQGSNNVAYGGQRNNSAGNGNAGGGYGGVSHGGYRGGFHGNGQGRRGNRGGNNQGQRTGRRGT